MKKEELYEPSGVLILNKHAGVTSFDIVNRVRRLFGTRRVGHAGTLDPMATGVLVVLVGRAAKATEYIVSDRKTYRAVLRLGMTTDTEDSTGMLLTQTEKLPTQTEVEAVLPHFRGKLLQTPPMYSALKINGQKLVDLARKGEVIERRARPIEIFSLNLTPTPCSSDYLLEVACSGGTYIRTLCADIGAKLGCGGVMAALERTEACGFLISQAHTLAELEGMTEEERSSWLIPTASLFASFPEIRLSAFHEKLIRSGCAVDQKKLKTDHPIGTRLRVCDAAGSFFALADVIDTDGIATVKAVKTFVL